MEPSQPLTAEEEAVKRSTDCVYFLASPLTCKKGIECEFRHCEGARVNPRDCWYWLNGNCLNPKCSFRHPPLDGLFENPGAPPGPVPPTLQAAAATQFSKAPAPGAYNQNKQSVPCYYFQMGQCLKGDKCQFMHGPHPPGNLVTPQVNNGSNPVGNHNKQQVAKVSTSFTGASQTVSWGPKECATQQNIPKPGTHKPVQVLLSSAKSSNISKNALNNSQPLNKAPSPYSSEYEPPRSQPIIAPVSSDSTPSRPRHRQPAEEHHQNGREADEFLGESSPGFDVLVDDDIGDSDYYNDEEFQRASVHGGKNPSHSVNDFDYNRSDYEPAANFERDQFNGKGEYDRYSRGHNQNGQDHRRASSDRIMDRPPMPRRAHRESSPHEMDGSDLRNRLIKQRRLSGSRSAVSPDRRDESRRHDDHYAADRYHGRSSGRDRRQYPHENSVSSRLQGRIKLPPRSSQDRPIESRSERERDRGRMRTRISPVRSVNHQGRPHDGIRRRPNEDNTADGRSFGGRPDTRENGDPLNFAGPKSLAELKGVKNSVSGQEQPAKSISEPLAPGYQASEASLPFEGPKSLSALKRKRENEPVNGSLSTSGDEHDVVLGSGSASTALSGMQPLISSNAVEEVDLTASDAGDPMVTKEEEEEEEGLIRSEGQEVLYVGGQSSGEGTAHEVDDGRQVDDIEEDQDIENYDLRDEDYDSEYKEVVGGEMKAEDEDNAYLDEEVAYQEEDEELDDEDDFAKKVGVFFS
ncbi:zinc finger CCCH domain-containing protein 32 [Iris pallida]|uniref:Zinc finger CCCH domain-containing protein 32 n=1 Tax=Iris pallida TaxID=29817 RepID=A0AAX6HE91_IRIPA|nr:zinc finger CCCH domain-containing protein 32 [Iris pallida]